jgi:hypothetical protein
MNFGVHFIHPVAKNQRHRCHSRLAGPTSSIVDSILAASHGAALRRSEAGSRAAAVATVQVRRNGNGNLQAQAVSHDVQIDDLAGAHDAPATLAGFCEKAAAGTPRQHDESKVKLRIIIYCQTKSSTTRARSKLLTFQIHLRTINFRQSIRCALRAESAEDPIERPAHDRRKPESPQSAGARSTSTPTDGTC